MSASPIEPRLRPGVAKYGSHVFDLVYVTGTRRHLADEPAKLANDAAIRRMKNMFVAAIRRSIRGHDKKGAATLVDALLDYQPTLWGLLLNEGINPRR